MSRLSSRLVAGFVLVAATATVASAGTWQIDTAHSVLDFKIRHLFSNTGGNFQEWSGTLEFDPADLSSGSAEIVVQTASIDTENEDRDNHLRSADFFDVEKYPTMTFKSTKVVQNGDQWELHGDFTLHGVTQPVVIPFEFHGAGKDPWGNDRAGFSGELKINRKDYGLTWNKALDQGGFILGDEVTIDIEVEAMQAAQAGR